MSAPPLIIYALSSDAPTLNVLLKPLLDAGYPAGFGVTIAGEASEAELADPDWDAAILRWNEPEFHEIALLERAVVGQDEEADAAIAAGIAAAEALPLSAGRFITLDHLRHTLAVFAWNLQPALLDNDNHPAWEALDIALRTLAEKTDGLIYAEAEGFYDFDGEPMVADADFGENNQMQG